MSENETETETKAETEAEAKAPKGSPKPSENKCAKDGCKRPYRAKGYCVTHYKLWRRGQLDGHKARYKVCSKEACKKSAGRYGLCQEHRGGAKAAEAEAPAAT